MTTVYVTAWAYDTGGGFDWYSMDEDANHAYTKEQEIAAKSPSSHWTAFRFDFRSSSVDPEVITREIDLEFALCTIPNEVE